jgi:hypothetical protein
VNGLQAIDGQRAEVGLTARLAIGGQLLRRGLLAWFGRRGAVQEVDRHHADGLRMLGAGYGCRELQEALGADKVDLESRTQRIAPPGDAMRLGAGLAEQGIVQGETQRSLLAQRCGDAAAHSVEQILGGNAALGKQPVSRRPILKLQAASGQQAGDGSASQTQQRTQREGLRPLVDSLLGAAGLALAPELLEAVEEERRVFFRTGGGAWGRRRASRDLSSMSHSTVSPRANSMA